MRRRPTGGTGHALAYPRARASAATFSRSLFRSLMHSLFLFVSFNCVSSCFSYEASAAKTSRTGQTVQRLVAKEPTPFRTGHCFPVASSWCPYPSDLADGWPVAAKTVLGSFCDRLGIFSSKHKRGAPKQVRTNFIYVCCHCLHLRNEIK